MLVVGTVGRKHNLACRTYPGKNSLGIGSGTCSIVVLELGPVLELVLELVVVHQSTVGQVVVAEQFVVEQFVVVVVVVEQPQRHCLA